MPRIQPTHASIIDLKVLKKNAVLSLDEEFGGGEKLLHNSTMDGWWVEREFMGTELDTAESMVADWVSAGVKEISMKAMTLDGKGQFWVYNIKTKKWQTKAALQTAKRRKAA